MMDRSIKFIKIFILNDKLKKSDVKKEKIWKVLAEVNESGYGN